MKISHSSACLAKSDQITRRLPVVVALCLIVAAIIIALSAITSNANVAIAADSADSTNATTSANTNTANNPNKEFRLLFTHDTHSYLTSTNDVKDKQSQEHGDSARLATLVKQLKNANTVYADAGDITSGTLMQSQFKTKAEELRILGRAGCDVITWGNHEFDGGGYGLADMMNVAADVKNSGAQPMPEYVQSNVDFSGELTDEQKALKNASEKYGLKKYTIKDVNGVKVAFFGLEGPDSLDCAPTSGQKWTNYIEAAKQTLDEIGDKADIKVCLSHSSPSVDPAKGDDVELAKKVPGIDVIVSAHSHSTANEPVQVDKTLIVSSGSYLYNLGELNLKVNDDKTVSCTGYTLHRLNESVPEDPAMAAYLENCKKDIDSTYLAKYAPDTTYDGVLATCPYNFYGMDEMTAEEKEYPIGNLIADSYMYAAKQNGVNDIDVAVVPFGTIRTSFHEGNITTNDVFKVCSLGAGTDGSSGHPLVIAHLTGAELKLLLQMDVSMGGIKDSVRMSYSGLELTYNPNRMLLDRVTEAHFVDANGNTRPIEDDKLYKACVNGYTMNMVSLPEKLTKGILKIVPKNADGTPMDGYANSTLNDTTGQEIKEWVALKDYVKSLKIIPNEYDGSHPRKHIADEGGLAVIANPGLATILVIVVPLVLLGLIILIVWLIVRGVKKHKAKKKQASGEHKKE